LDEKVKEKEKIFLFRREITLKKTKKGGEKKGLLKARRKERFIMTN